MERVLISKVIGHDGKKPVYVSHHLCPKCRYKSHNLFHIRRHVNRMHTILLEYIQCCDESFVTKAEYYAHRQECHLKFRSSLSARTKINTSPPWQRVLTSTLQNGPEDKSPIVNGNSNGSACNVDQVVNSAIIESANISRRNEVINTNHVESSNLNPRRTNENETTENFGFDALAISTSSNVPFKKRIVRALAINNSENIAKTSQSFDDSSSHPVKSGTSVTRKIRLKFESANLGDSGTKASISNVENVPPIVHEQIIPHGEVDVNIAPRIVRQDVTRVQTSFWRPIDFNSFDKQR